MVFVRVSKLGSNFGRAHLSVLHPDLAVRSRNDQQLLGRNLPKDFILLFIDQLYFKNEHALKLLKSFSMWETLGGSTALLTVFFPPSNSYTAMLKPHSTSQPSSF